MRPLFAAFALVAITSPLLAQPPVAAPKLVAPPSIEIEIDREMAGLIGVTIEDCRKALVMANSSTRFTDLNYWGDTRTGFDYHLVEVLVPASQSMDLTVLERLPIKTVNANVNVMLRDVATVRWGVRPGEFDRNTSQRCLTVTDAKMPPAPPTLCKARAARQDGQIHILVAVPVTEYVHVPKWVAGKVVKTVTGKNGVPIEYEVMVMKKVYTIETRMLTKTVSVNAADKSVRVTDKDGKAVDPRDLLKLLVDEKEVLVVGKEDRQKLPKLAEGTLVIRADGVLPPPPQPPPSLNMPREIIPGEMMPVPVPAPPPPAPKS